jgi:hypothetical protein
MNETLSVSMEAKLIEELRQTTKREGTSLDQVIADLAERYLREVREQALKQEAANYQTMHTDLKEKYLGRHVAIFEGKLVDHDVDAMALVRRVRQNYGQLPVFITQVSETPVREFTVRRPQLIP